MKSMDILLVEDDMGDFKLTEEALKDSKIYVTLNHVDDGEKAIQYLRKQGEYAQATTPDLVLLDLNMPRKDGRETLAEIKADVNLKKIPVVILTTSLAKADINKTYDLGANCYVNKPIDFEKFEKVIQGISDFWFAIVKLPGTEA